MSHGSIQVVHGPATDVNAQRIEDEARQLVICANEGLETHGHFS